ncbi:translation initiation factor 2 [Paenibacillus sp. LHD-117]|uniref:translation initiation factor 2 n=1 Tax=Paenibacillus sp. LHD-117 TaxID=3071412 RepID=UPI0027E03D1F|nr:translation initiation factor 2 [Paenibacillus sp. LHD-117]MDQ6420899.1 translation initiation factor 2 [Paenibacillus sp. LHD-117]
MDEKQKLLREIEITRLEFIGASLAAIGDGILAFSAGLALEMLENELVDQSRTQHVHIAATQNQLDYFIHELMKIRKTIT